ncbi:KUP/HAK/KT family potassium transporter [Novosphingobium fluoreni]|uniref:KUP/HAK/KT family potassium transporter n=1 Tax=Novosphingobium fluoreni TaxID=1391222 RepID=UPI003DA135A1
MPCCITSNTTTWLHRHNYITTVKTLRPSDCDEADRLEIIPVDENFCRLVLRYGFMETPSVRDDLIAAGIASPRPRGQLSSAATIYAMSAEVGMPAVGRICCSSACTATLPTRRIIPDSAQSRELGAQYAI